MPDGDCQEGRSGISAERAVASAGVTYDRENLGGFVTTVSLCRKKAGLRILHVSRTAVRTTSAETASSLRRSARA